MKTTISFLTQEETKRLFAAIPSKRDRALFLTAYRYTLRLMQLDGDDSVRVEMDSGVVVCGSSRS